MGSYSYEDEAEMLYYWPSRAVGDRLRWPISDPYYMFTFVIDSNSALKAWADNAPGNDYKRVLIKKGTYTYSNTIDISNGRTKCVVGEPESLIIINAYYGIIGKVTGTYPNLVNPGRDYFLEM